MKEGFEHCNTESLGPSQSHSTALAEPKMGLQQINLQTQETSLSKVCETERITES